MSETNNSGAISICFIHEQSLAAPTHQSGAVTQHDVAVFQGFDAINFGSHRIEMVPVLQGVFKRTETIVGWDLPVPHNFSLPQLIGGLGRLYGPHLHVGMVLLVILLGEGVAVVQQEVAAQQPYRLAQLEVFWGVVLIHFLRCDLQHTAGEGVWRDRGRVL